MATKPDDKPKSLIQQFAGNPELFLNNNIVIVSDQSQADVGKDKVSTSAGGKKAFEYTQIKTFQMREKQKGVMFLEKELIKKPGSIRAYWLPWNSAGGVCADLATDDNAPEWLFTSELSNCRFSILEGGGKFKVAHISGTSSSGYRDEWESDHFLPKADEATRRLTRNKNELKYRGQDGDNKSSAFVFGRRTGTNWTFHAQVASGILAGAALDKLPSSIDLITPYATI
jgi:hypothetical protein